MDSKEKEILIKHEKRSKDGFNSLEKYVIEQKSCNYCGSCVSVCPKEVEALIDGIEATIDATRAAVGSLSTYLG